MAAEVDVNSHRTRQNRSRRIEAHPFLHDTGRHLQPFEIAPRETVAIVGESGSGKSVTALSIMRLLPPANSRVQGEVLLEGRDLLRLAEGEMRKVRGDQVSMIFQEPMTAAILSGQARRGRRRTRCSTTSRRTSSWSSTSRT